MFNSSMSRRHAMLGSLALAPVAARAQGIQSRPIRLIVPAAPGGGLDTTARVLAPPMGTSLGRTILVENRGGAGNMIGEAEVARQPPDGNTLLLDSMAHVVNPAVVKSPPFDFLTAFAPISQVVALPLVLVVPNSLPVSDVAGLIAYLKKNPGAPYGSPGNASAGHLAAALFLYRSGTVAEHVPYRGGGPALPDLITGRVNFFFGTVSILLQVVQSNQARAIAVSSPQRVTTLPDIPTMAEQGLAGYEMVEWNGLFAPGGITPATRDRIFKATQDGIADARLRQTIEQFGGIVVGSDPATFTRYLDEQRTAMAKLVQEASIQID